MTLSIQPDVDPCGRMAVEHLVQTGGCRSASYVRQSPSTNSWALEELRRGDGGMRFPRLYLTDQQTAGRGRHGRTWVSTDGVLTFSLTIELPTHDAGSTPVGYNNVRHRQLLAIAVGVGVARAIEFELAPLRVHLKWPNDLHVDGRKAGGILLEAVSANPNAIVAGVGLNVNQRPEVPDTASAHPAGDLASAAGRSLHRYDLLVPLVESILETIAETSASSDEVIAEFRQRCVLSGHAVAYQYGSQTRTGICRGINQQGELQVETEQGLQTVSAGEANRVRKARHS